MHINTVEGVQASWRMLVLIFFKEIGFSLLKFWINIFLKRAQDFLHISCSQSPLLFILTLSMHVSPVSQVKVYFTERQMCFSQQ